MIRLENVCYRYPDTGNPAVDGLTMEVSGGELLAVIGPNGSGKSTLARLLNGLIVPDSGQVLVDGLDTSDADAVWEIRRRVGLILQNPDNQLIAPTVEEDVAFGPENLGIPPAEIRQRVARALENTKLAHLANCTPNKLSGGEKQRVALAGILAMQPDYLVLDEATSMLDPKSRKEIIKLLFELKAGGVGAVMITHDMGEAVLADRVMVLNHGKPELCGTPQQVLGDAASLRKIGLDTTLAARIANRLRQHGWLLSKDILSVEELVKSICF